MSNTRSRAWMSDLAYNWARFASNGTNLGTFNNKPKCSETNLKKVLNSLHFLSKWPNLRPNLTSMGLTECCSNVCLCCDNSSLPVTNQRCQIRLNFGGQIVIKSEKSGNFLDCSEKTDLKYFYDVSYSVLLDDNLTQFSPMLSPLQLSTRPNVSCVHQYHYVRRLSSVSQECLEWFKIKCKM